MPNDSMELFPDRPKRRIDPRAPLADRMRPQAFEEMLGQEHLTDEGSALRAMLACEELPSLILWGPPGSGKRAVLKALVSHLQIRGYQTLLFRGRDDAEAFRELQSVASDLSGSSLSRHVTTEEEPVDILFRLRSGKIAVLLSFDEEDVGGLADPFADEIIDDAAGFRPAFHRHVVDQAGLELALDLAAQVRPGIEKGHERGAVDLDRLGGDGGAHRRRARRVRKQCHLADVVARGHVGQNDVATADIT